MTLDSLNIARGYFLKAVLNLDKLILTVGIWVYEKKKNEVVWTHLNFRQIVFSECKYMVMMMMLSLKHLQNKDWGFLKCTCRFMLTETIYCWKCSYVYNFCVVLIFIFSSVSLFSLNIRLSHCHSLNSLQDFVIFRTKVTTMVFKEL